MFHLDTNDSLIHLWYMWRFVGIYPYEKLKWVYNFYGIVVNLTASVLSPIFVFVNVFFLGDIGLIIHNLQASLTLIVSSLKQFVIFLRFSDLRKVKLLLNQLDQRASRNTDEVEYMKNVIKQCRFMTLAIEIAFIFSVLSYAIPGLIKGRLVFEGWFPLDSTSSTTYYLIAFGFQFLTVSFQIIQNSANDAYPPVYMNVLKGHIHVLCMRVARIGHDRSSTPDQNFIELKSCINDHKNTIRLFETIAPVISQTVMLQFIITGLVLCLTVVHFLIFNRDFGQLVSTIFYICGILSETFPVCHFGNALMSETDSLTNAIYSCNWMDQSMKFRKCVIIFMQRSQNTNMIKAGGLIAITLETFIDIIRFSFSMYTLLSEIQL